MESLIQKDQNKTTAVKNQLKVRPHPFRILLVDDDEDFLEAMTQQLKHDIHCLVVQATNPYEAMNALIESYFDLVIVDWELQSMSGWSALQKTDEVLKIDSQISPKWGRAKVPVILISADPMNEIRALASTHFQKVGFLSKIQGIQQISDGVRQLIEKKKFKAS